MNEQPAEHKEQFWVAVLAGIGIGAVVAGLAALMMAPEPGAKLRCDLREAAGKLKDRFEGLAGRLKACAESAVEQRRGALAEAWEAGRAAYAQKRAELENKLGPDR